MSPEPRGLGATLKRARGATRLARVAGTVSVSNLDRRLRRRVLDVPEMRELESSTEVARKILRNLGFDLDVSGPAPSGLFILVANHRSYADVPVIASQVSCAFLSKGEIASWPLFGTAARLGHTVFVQRESRESRRAALASMRRLLRQNVPVAVFPEGTTTAGPGVLPFRWGSFRLSVETRVPIVPAALVYGDARDAWVDEQDFLLHFLDRFGEIRPRAALRFGPPMLGNDFRELASEAERWIRRELRGLGEPAPVPDERPAGSVFPGWRPALAH